MTERRSLWLALAVVLFVALVARVLLLLSGSVSFHSDEAVVGLMARHILNGERPVFFYGQAYMGSVDAWLVAGGFALFGQSVLTIRVVQSLLYLGVVAASFWCAWLWSRQTAVALITGLLFAVPPVLIALYTTATLGGYNETLLFGTLGLGLAWQVTHDHARTVWRWLLMGGLFGVGWWANGLIVLFGVPALALIAAWAWQGLRRHEVSAGRVVGSTFLAALAFLVGSAPWWAFALQYDWAPLRFFVGAPPQAGFAGTDVVSLALPERLIGLFLLGFPTLLGLRFPWSPSYVLIPLSLVALALFIAALVRLTRPGPLQPRARLLIAGMIGLFALVFLGTRFSSDPTGRYFLPLALPLFVTFAAFAASIQRWWLGALMTAGVIAVFGAGQIVAASTAPGLTTQFNLVTHIPANDDEALIAFLRENDLTRGYSTYWISFRMAFLSDEILQYSASLPYKPDLSYTPLDERYPPYRAAADGSPRVAIITANVPEVDALVVSQLEGAGVDWTETQIGPYRVYHDFDPPEAVPRPPFAAS